MSKNVEILIWWRDGSGRYQQEWRKAQQVDIASDGRKVVQYDGRQVFKQPQDVRVI